VYQPPLAGHGLLTGFHQALRWDYGPRVGCRVRLRLVYELHRRMYEIFLDDVGDDTLLADLLLDCCLGRLTATTRRLGPWPKRRRTQRSHGPARAPDACWQSDPQLPHLCRSWGPDRVDAGSAILAILVAFSCCISTSDAESLANGRCNHQLAIAAVCILAGHTYQTRRAAGHLPGRQRAARVRLGRAGGVHGHLGQRGPRGAHAQAAVRPRRPGARLVLATHDVPDRPHTIMARL